MFRLNYFFLNNLKYNPKHVVNYLNLYRNLSFLSMFRLNYFFLNNLKYNPKHVVNYLVICHKHIIPKNLETIISRKQIVKIHQLF